MDKSVEIYLEDMNGENFAEICDQQLITRFGGRIKNLSAILKILGRGNVLG